MENLLPGQETDGASAASLTLQAKEQALALLAPDLQAGKAFIEASLAPATQAAYAKIWRDFSLYCKERSLQALPASPQTVVAYLSFLATLATSRKGKAGQRYNTVAKARAALATLHRVRGFPSPCDDTFVEMSLAGIGRSIGRRTHPMDALPTDALRKMAQAAKDAGGMEGVRDRAVLLFGFCGAFRRSEFTALNKGDLEPAGSKGIIAHLRKSKTDQTGLGRKVPVACDPDPAMCPVLALQDYLQVAGLAGQAGLAGLAGQAGLSEPDIDPETPVFRSITRGGRLSDSRMCDQAVWRVLDRWAKACGVEGRIGAHSLRSGFVTAAAKNKKPLQSIMKKTGHRRADTVLKYIRDAELFEGDAAEGIF